MGEHYFKARRGDLEFEVRGDRDFVEETVERWASLVFTYPAVREPERAAAERQSVVSAAASPARIRVRKNISFEDFLALKRPETATDRLLTLAYFLEKYEGRSRYELSELEQAWSHSYPDDAFKPEVWRDAVARGYLEELDDRFTLTFAGEGYVQNGLADRFGRL